VIEVRREPQSASMPLRAGAEQAPDGAERIAITVSCAVVAINCKRFAQQCMLRCKTRENDE
jgi:hypothetical protein